MMEAGGGGSPAAAVIRLPRVDDPTAILDVADFRGRPVVVNFWASWCVPCRREMPALQAVADRFGDRITLVGVNHQDGRKGARALVDDLGVRFPSGYDPKGEIGRELGVRGLPTTVFLSADGAVVALRPGEVDEEDVEKVLADELGVRLDGNAAPSLGPGTARSGVLAAWAAVG